MHLFIVMAVVVAMVVALESKVLRAKTISDVGGHNSAHPSFLCVYFCT